MASNQGDSRRLLVITADDYGYWPSYNQGILEAIEMGAIDCVSAMVDREYCEPEPLLETGVEIGLHIEFEARWGPRSGAPARTSLRVQLDRFGRPVRPVALLPERPQALPCPSRARHPGLPDGPADRRARALGQSRTIDSGSGSAVSTRRTC